MAVFVSAFFFIFVDKFVLENQNLFVENIVTTTQGKLHLLKNMTGT